MKIKSLYPIIVTENAEKTLEFYTALGFTKKHEIPTKIGSHVYIIANEGFEMEIMEAVANGPASFSTGYIGVRMNVDDLDAAIETVKQAGGTIVTDVFETAFAKGVITKDANGNNITLMQHLKK